MKNETMETILTRRSMRSFLPDDVPDGLLRSVLTAGQYAPSGSNSQSWRFTAVCGAERLARLNEAVKGCFCAMSYPEDAYPAKRAAVKNSRNPDYHFCYRAPVLILVSNLAGYTNAVADSAAAIENMLLAAHSLGLASCWINQVTWLGEREDMRAYLREEYGIPENHRVCGGLALGFPAGKAPPAAPRREGCVSIIR
ncbi:MAG: nitroreductase [Eubacteriales bacterium]|nr:nitroreductase [Eubacteriales bacterium]